MQTRKLAAQEQGIPIAQVNGSFVSSMVPLDTELSGYRAVQLIRR
jgi:hypothetical protein